MKSTYRIATLNEDFEVANVDQRFSEVKKQVEKILDRKIRRLDIGQAVLVGSKQWTVEAFEDAKNVLIVAYNSDRLSFKHVTVDEYRSAMSSIGCSFQADANRMEAFARYIGLPDSVQIKASISQF